MFHLEPLRRLRILRVLWIDGRGVSLLRWGVSLLGHRLRITLVVVHDNLNRLRLVSAGRNELATLFLLFTRRWGALTKGGVQVAKSFALQKL